MLAALLFAAAFFLDATFAFSACDFSADLAVDAETVEACDSGADA